MGTLPAFSTTNTPNLITLNIQENMLSGTLPPTLMKIPTLRSLAISYQKQGATLSGTIPSTIAADLKEMSLPQHRLSGTISESSMQLESLVELHTRGNTMLSGTLTANISLPRLRHWFGFDTRVSGNLPASIGHLSNLISLGLSHTQLSSTVPASFVFLSSLIVLDLSGCSLRGDLSGLSPSHQLRYLHAESNRISGGLQLAPLE